MYCRRILLSIIFILFASTAVANTADKMILVCHVGSELGPEGQPYDPYCDPGYSDCSADAGKVDLIEAPRNAKHIRNDEHAYLDAENFLWKDYSPGAGVGDDPADFEDLNLDGIDDGCELESLPSVNHTFFSNDADYQAADAPGLNPDLEGEVPVIDDELPGIVIAQIDTVFGEPTDTQTIILEGISGLSDDYELSLTRLPTGTVTIKLNLDDRLAITSSDLRFDAFDDAITFTAADWNNAVRLTVAAVDDAIPQGPTVLIISHTVEATVAGRDTSFDAVTGALDVEVYDDETAGAFVIESGGSTVVTRDGTVTDDYAIGLTRAPTANVRVSVETDGRFDVDTINGSPEFYTAIGSVRLVELFCGGIDFANNELGQATLTRGLDGDRGSFIKDGFFKGMLLQVDGAGPGYDNDYIVTDVSRKVLTMSFGIGNPAKIQESGVVLSQQVYQGFESSEVNADPVNRRLDLIQGFRSTNSWSVDGFLAGQRVRVTNLNNPAQFADFKIAYIAAETLEFTIEGTWPAWLSGTPIVRVQQIAKSATFTPANWDQLQTIVLKGDPNF